MSVTLKIPPKLTYKKRALKLSEHILHTLDQYVAAAKETQPQSDMTADVVVGLILEEHFKRDKHFQHWLAQQHGTGQDHKPS